MRLSRSTKAVVIGAVALAVFAAGRAAAHQTPSSDAASSHSTSAGAKHSAAAKHSAGAKPPAHHKPAHSGAGQASSTDAVAAGGAHAKAATVQVSKVAAGPAGSHMSTGTKAVALTFDDGPDPNQTPKILKLLAQQHVHATFCLIGKNVQAHPQIVRQIVAGGHTICDHTWSHSLTIGKEPVAEIRADLQRTNAAILKAAPNAKVKYFRAPGGNFTPRLVSVAKSLGMTSIYWRVDPRDWDHPAGETDAAHRARVISTVEQRVHSGSIVLSHDYNQPDTIAAYRILIPWLHRRFQLVALP